MGEIDITDIVQRLRETCEFRTVIAGHCFEELCEVWIALCHRLNRFFDRNFILGFDLEDKLITR